MKINSVIRFSNVNTILVPLVLILLTLRANAGGINKVELSYPMEMSTNSDIPINDTIPLNPSILVGESENETKIRVAQEQKREQDISASKRDVITRETPSRTSGPSFDEKRRIVKEIASKYNMDWKVLEAVWEVESGKSWDRDVRSYAGAQGPMQFLPSTFRHYAEPGASITSAIDSLHAGANLLSSAGASSGNVEKALFAYNHSSSYVAKVKRIAGSIN